MATNLIHKFEDTHISLNVIEPTNVTGNDAHIARRFWTDQEKPVVNNQPVSKDTKNSWYGQFMSCMEIDWGNAKGDDENNFDKSTISESAIRDILFTNGIKTSDELLTVLCWLYHNRYVAPLPIYLISWNGNGATANATGSTQVTQGETVTIPTTAPIREYTLSWNDNGATTAHTGGSLKMEYTFNNWWTSATGGSQVTNATVPTGDSTYFAHWTPNAITLPTINPKRKYTITWDVNGGTGTPTGGTTEVTYTFNNWWTKTSGGTQVTSSTTATAKATYYAHWTAPTGNLQLPTNTLTRSGYTFKGWATTANATAGNVTSSITLASITENKTYYAVWEAEATTYYWYVGFDPSIENAQLTKTKLQTLGSASTKAGYSTSYTSWPTDVQITTQSGYCYIVAPKTWIDGKTKFFKDAINATPVFYNLKDDQSTLGFNPEFIIDGITYSVYCSESSMAAGAIFTSIAPTN